MDANDLKVIQLGGHRVPANCQLLLPKIVSNKHGGALLREHIRRLRRYLMLRPVGIPVRDNPCRHLLDFRALIRETRMLSKSSDDLRPFAQNGAPEKFPKCKVGVVKFNTCKRIG
jgi:hypothetical protein